MAGTSYRSLRRLVGVVVCLLLAASMLTASSVVGTLLRKPFRVIQMNLCS
ncbi:hypothetical protein HC031_30835 [Planosporangium thailandense]|uniref:Uncharacterized protein n=1 Tax=Planosporangium thailandense TaxID=765197 RepID=A0ABX0Y9K1_9ACTN|nr:hypothetical protein [Planosporangium thailandense]NJC74078.1 hypothetical protein [Planosporangium thailandense]